MKKTTQTESSSKFRKSLWALALLLALTFIVSKPERARATLVLLNGGYVNYPAGSTNLSLVQVGTVSLSPQTLFLQNNGLASTNACVITATLTFDGTNFFLTPFNTPFPTTNANAQLVWNIPQTNYPIYGTIHVVTTNTVGLSAAVQQ